ncbi:MAG: hypothetical protein EXR99_09100 [Gemmataceae bacterium]|nr:hypothetical protein [Gemmataceae bacterium]
MKPVCQKVPLLNSGSPGDTVPGALGQPGTATILGNDKFEMPVASGVRATIGFWLPDCPDLGWDVSGFWLQKVTNTQSIQSQDGATATFVPFVDQNNVAKALPFSVPGVIDGSVVATGSSELWGAETNALWRFAEQGGDSSGRRVSLLVGFRYVHLRDEIAIVQTQTSVANPALTATGVNNYVTKNDFFGPQIGARLEIKRGRWSIEATGKFFPGETNLRSDISGSPLIAGAQLLPGSVPGPLLAFPSNIGQQETWAFSFVEEFNLKLRCLVATNVHATFGYNLLYLNRIACPGDQMPQIVNISQLPQFGPLVGKVLPSPILRHTDYFAQGLSGGLEFRY